MRSKSLLLILILLGASAILRSFMMDSKAFALSKTGIGITKEGPLTAQVGETIEYTITAYNLGDFWIRNITVKDDLPNNTILLWDIPDLAPLNETENSFTIEILYTISETDVIATPIPHIQNQAEVTGYVDVEGLSEMVYANTSFPTKIIEIPVLVGGYSFPIETVKPDDLLTTHTIYFALLLAMSATYTRMRTVYKTKKRFKTK
jgi:uncharacterized repeat protein (TIGR01451 family)